MVAPVLDMTQQKRASITCYASQQFCSMPCSVKLHTLGCCLACTTSLIATLPGFAAVHGCVPDSLVLLHCAAYLAAIQPGPVDLLPPTQMSFARHKGLPGKSEHPAGLRHALQQPLYARSSRQPEKEPSESYPPPGGDTPPSALAAAASGKGGAAPLPAQVGYAITPISVATGVPLAATQVVTGCGAQLVHAMLTKSHLNAMVRHGKLEGHDHAVFYRLVVCCSLLRPHEAYLALHAVLANCWCYIAISRLWLWKEPATTVSLATGVHRLLSVSFACSGS